MRRYKYLFSCNVVISFLLCAILGGCFFSFAFPCCVNAETTPGFVNPGIVLQGSQDQPNWMVLWDKARNYARQGDQQKSAAMYRELFLEKPLIEEALREYVVVLMGLSRWRDAWGGVQNLLEMDSQSLEYQLYAGRIALVLGRYQRALQHLGLVFTMSPRGPWSVEALKGQIVSLQELGRKDMAFPLMEQLYLFVPHDEDIIRSLAQESLQLGFTSKALSYYQTLISEFQGTEQDFWEAEPLFVASGVEELAAQCWQGYLAIHPSYLPFHIKLSQYYLKKGQGEEALPHLLVRIAHGEAEPEIFLQIGKVYLNQKGRPDKALHFYDEYRKRKPGDRKILSEIQKIRAALANDLLSIVENVGASTLWRDLAEVVPDRLAVYYSMAEQLESLGRESSLLEVTKIIHQHNPDDQNVLFTLAKLYLNKGDLESCTDILDTLADEKQSGKEYFTLRTTIEEQRGQFDKALDYYIKYLKSDSHDYSVLIEGIKRASDLGLISKLQAFYSLLPDSLQNKEIYKQGGLLYGDGLFHNNLYTTARNFYRRFLETDTLSKDETYLVQLRIVKTLQLEHKVFEAEQYLRILLIENGYRDELVYRLIQTAILEKDWSNAWKWYEVLVHEYSVETYEQVVQKIQIYAESGKRDVAIALAKDFLTKNKDVCSKRQKQCAELNTMLAEYYYSNKEYDKAKEILDTVVTIVPKSLALSVLGKLIEKQLHRNDNTPLVSFDTQISEQDLIERALLYKKYGDYQAALQNIQKYLAVRPTELRARVLHAQLLADSSDDSAALSRYKQLSSEFPEESSCQQAVNALEFKMAKFESLIARLAPQWHNSSSRDLLFVSRTIPPEIGKLNNSNKLLLARTFWATRRWNIALVLYGSLLQPPVEYEFSKQVKENNVSLLLQPPKRSLFNVVTFTNPAEPELLSTVMDPDFTRENITDPVVSIAVKLYSSYRWQQLINRELSVRGAISKGNYYQAMKEYQNLLVDDSSPESLFDLAGVYSRLGFSGKEAALYEKMKQTSPEYPNLDEAIRRNSLKRQPRIAPFGAIKKKTGRDDHFDNIQRTVGMQAWFMPSLQHEAFIDVRRSFSKSEKVEQDLWYNRLYAELAWSPMYDLDILLGVGETFIGGGSGNTFLYNTRINGRIGDIVQGHFGISEDIVDDSVESLTKVINKKQYQAGMQIDFLPRLFAGGEYLFTEFSDGNHQNRYELWSSYIVLSEPTLLKLRYGYEFSHNADGNDMRDYSYTSGFIPSDHPYWSPKEYWQNVFTLSFEHQLTEDVLGRGAPSFYSLEYSFGYEIGGYDNHELKAEIFLEMSRHFLLNSNVEFTHGANQKDFNFLVSIIYRW